MYEKESVKLLNDEIKVSAPELIFDSDSFEGLCKKWITLKNTLSVLMSSNSKFEIIKEMQVTEEAMLIMLKKNTGN